MLITLAIMKDELGIATLDTTQDTRLTRMINSVGEAFKQHTGRAIESATYTLEAYKGTDTPRLVLNNHPVTALTLVSVSNVDVTTQCTSLSGGIIERTGGVFESLKYCNPINDSGIDGAYNVNNVKVTYTAGYTTIPYDIQEACIMEVQQRYNKYLQGSMADVKSESLLSGSVSYDVNSNDAASGFLQSTRAVLDRYADVI